MEELQHIQDLWERWVKGTASPEEASELAQWVEAHADEELLPLLDSIARGLEPDPHIPTSHWESLFQSLTEKIRKRPAHIRTIPGRTWWAAAVSLLLISFGTYIYLHNRLRNTPIAVEAPAFTGHDLTAPAGTHATILLAGGQKILVDSIQNGAFVTQGGAHLVKLGDGRIAYEGATRKNAPLLYNTLFNPRGSRPIDITLADGTRVWLNAGSSLKYPATFSGPTREVEMGGEAYFEVARNGSSPFLVKKGTTEVQVLGTSFNVYAYDDEPELKITLLDGAIKVNATGGTGNPASTAKILHPGEQALVQSSTVQVMAGIDLQQVMAWKNGLFNFNNADIREILRQAARWYDIDVVYQGAVTDDRYKGTISRQATLGQLLQIFELNKIRFSLKGRQLTVL